MIKDLCFEITQKCPNNCLFCSSCSSYDCESFISLDKFKETVSFLHDKYGLEEVSLSGGEPFLHPNIFEMIEHLTSLGIRSVIFTSGIKLRPQLNIDMSKLSEPEQKIITQIGGNRFCELTKLDFYELEKRGLNRIVFDFQASDVDTYNKLMGTKNQFCNIAKSILNAGTSKIETDVHFIPLKDNFEQLPDIIELLNIAGIKNLSLLKFVPQGRGKENIEQLTLSASEQERFKEIVTYARNTFNGNLRIGIPLSDDSDHKCNAGFTKLVIKYDGTVLPCPAFKELTDEEMKKYGIRLGSIYEELDSIKLFKGIRAVPLCSVVYKES